jgi:hypothetical protein
MKRILKIALPLGFFATVVTLAGVAPGFWPLAELQAAGDGDVTYDVACDCRTGVAGPNRGDPFIIQGKIFPAGTLPAGAATNDPTQAVNGVSPIGNWICRGQNSFPIPAVVAPAYALTPAAFNTQYFILNDGRGLTAEGYDVLPAGELLSITGGIRGLSGATGFIEEGPFGANVTGCPNFRAKFHIQAGSVRPN